MAEDAVPRAHTVLDRLLGVTGVVRAKTRLAPLGFSCAVRSLAASRPTRISDLELIKDNLKSQFGVPFTS